MPSPAVIYVSTGEAFFLPFLRGVRGSGLRRICVFYTADTLPSRREDVRQELRKRIAMCDAVVHIVGPRFGPGPEANGEARRSFAQMEYDLAAEMERPLYVVRYEPLFSTTSGEPEELAQLQRHHLEAIASSRWHPESVDSMAGLEAFIRGVRDRLSGSGWSHSCALGAYAAVRAPALSLPTQGAAPPGAKPPVQPPSPPIALPKSANTVAPSADGPGQAFPAENVVFTAYRPGSIRVGRWEKLLFFAHLDEKPDWLDDDERTPIEQMEAEAAGILGRKLDQYSRHSGDSRFPVPRDGEITLVPEMPGVEFDPPRRSFFWRPGDAVHGETFRLCAGAALDGGIARGRITVFLGALILAEIGLAIRVGGGPAGASAGTRKSRASPFRKIFASYSHRDLEVVETLERQALSLGDQYLRDWVHLRSGEQWDARLLELVEQADVFQLFWSHNSARSPYVEREWRHALRLGREAFVRPTYWERPMPPPPADLAGIHFHRLTPPAAPPAAPAPPVGEGPSFSPPSAAARASPPAGSAPPGVAFPFDPPAAPPRASSRMADYPPPPPPLLAPSLAARSSRLIWWLIPALILLGLLIGYWLRQRGP